MEWIQVIALLGGALLLAVMLQDAFEVMLLPRRVQRHVRVATLWFRFAWTNWARFGRRFARGAPREAFLSPFGPMSMLIMFAIWASGLVLSFGLIYWAFQANPRSSPLFEQVYMSGVTFFTLGYGDVVPHTTAARTVAVGEAGTGIGFIAVVIGYLPVLYQLFSRREAHVIQLDGRAGSPPTAGTLLTRHAEGGGMDQLDTLLREWEIWASELLESHLSYPMLAYYRSQHVNESWLSAIGCIMDTCALVLVGVQDMRPLQARMTFTMARQVLVEMARSFAVRPSRYTGGDRLDAEGYRLLQAALAGAGVAWSPGDGGQETLAALRATYEPLLDGLGRHLLLDIPGWLPANDEADNWEQGPRGLIAARLIEELSSRWQQESSPSPLGQPGWRRLRRRLQDERTPP